MIGVSHPGKIGDALYSLPSIRKIAEKHNSKVDFYTSAHCAPLEKLLKKQDCIQNFIIPTDYRIQRYDCGVQPWYMGDFINSEHYQHVYHLGFSRTPDKPLPNFISELAGLDSIGPISYNFDEVPTLSEPYIVLCPGSFPRYHPLFLQLIERSRFPVVQLGSRGEFIGNPEKSIDKTGLDFYDCLSWIKNSQVYVGLLSGMLALANGFPNLRKVVPCNWNLYDKSHIINTDNHHYALDPDIEELMFLVDFTYSQTLKVDRYFISEAQHIANMENMLGEHLSKMNHVHRRWEYGMALRFLREVQAKKILDVGGGGSLFAPAASWIGLEIAQLDASLDVEIVSHQSEKIGKPLIYYPFSLEDFQGEEQYDAVTCLSVIEHVEEDEVFFRKLLRFVKPGGHLFLTTDFHPSGQTYLFGKHLRTYSEASIFSLIKIAQEQGFTPYDRINYNYPRNIVNNHTFVSIALVRQSEFLT